MTIRFYAFMTGNFGYPNERHRDWREDVPVVITAELDTETMQLKVTDWQEEEWNKNATT